MTNAPSAGLVWFKSSYSSNEGPDCIEVASSPGTVHVRDSKDRQGPQLTFAAPGWAGFVSYAAGQATSR
ncbi:DUF397 domain-containing protein [Streptomyces sp. A3M-1-3]|uniref:DUF397 domain-containing protein n=1 Tax=Streptomyces sp. A3M-1-3 TaxID=2962044 RepID=UPI0020B710A6|nr:DUF397 domain-containing protein [Streptomyces sp. A3M-1-3]MCP3821993.1 DUF397 domain-containing protein [Streptomyces sp. A3M-1-3]